jgi:hypothetical protein
LGLGKLAGLHEFDLARRIYVATGGHVGIVSKLLVAAARRAAEGGRTLDRKLLGDTWADLRRKDQEPEDIDFDRDVMKDPVKPKPPVLREDNPLLCRADRVKAIWAAQRAAAAEAEAAKEVAKRGRRTIPGRRRSART